MRKKSGSFFLSFFTSFLYIPPGGCYVLLEIKKKKTRGGKIEREGQIEVGEPLN